MLKLFIVLLAVLDFLSGAINNTDMFGKVQRGIDVDIEQFPHSVLLLFKIVVPKTCGGSLITAQIVISAATCTDEFVHKDGMTEARMGHVLPKRAPVIRKVIAYKTAPGFKRNRMVHNLALLFLESRVVFGPTVKKIVLRGKYDGLNEGTLGFGIGWGKPIREKPNYAWNRYAKRAQQRIIDKKKCIERMNMKVDHILGPYTICAEASYGSFQRDEIGSGLVFQSNGYNYLGAVLAFVHESRIGVFTTMNGNYDYWIQKASFQLFEENCKKRGG